MKTDEETETGRPMNGWEAFTKITANISFTLIVLAVIGVVYVAIR